MRIRNERAVRKFLPILLTLLCTAAMAPAAMAQVVVGGHVGVVVPWVTNTSGSGNSSTTSISDAPALGFPLGVTFKGPGRFAFDLETVPFVNLNTQAVTFVVDPGILYSMDHGVTLGIRAAFSVNSNTIGFIPLVHVDNPFGTWNAVSDGGFFQSYFIEADLPINFAHPSGGPSTSSITFATHFGLGF
jgi:hypothetical protein